MRFNPDLSYYVLITVSFYRICEFSYWFGLRCFFGGAHCSATTGTRGATFIGMYVLSYIGGGNLLRYAEGATWLAIVTVSIFKICRLCTSHSCYSDKNFFYSV